MSHALSLQKLIVLKRIWLRLCISLLATVFATSQAAAINQSAPTDLKVGEGFVNPIGYYESNPRFSWKLPVQSQAQLQAAYRLQVAESHQFEPRSMLWDSGKVASNQNAWVRYEGEPLQSRQRVYWRVKTWSESNSESRWSEPQMIEFGLLSNHDWQAIWIGHPDTGERVTRPGQNGFPAIDNTYYRPQYLRTTFQLSKEVKQARLYVTAKGVFKPYLNGQAISEDMMTPGWTPYHKRIETLTYDVTEHLKKGENAIGASLAEGWTGRIFHPMKEDYVTPIRFLAQLEVQYKDGSAKTISTNKNWQSTDQGPIRSAGNYDGETYDANYEIPGWSTAGFNARAWSTVYSDPIDPEVLLQPKRHTAVRTTRIIPAIDIVSEKDGVVIYDMGQNMVGVPEIKVPAVKGQTIKLRFAEALEHGHFHTRNLRSAKNTDYYTPATTGNIQYRPTFTFHGYRYVELSGHDTRQTPRLEWVTGHVMHSNFDVYDNFTSSHSKLNKLSSNVEWGLRGNFLDIPTDCPQRDERLGWTGDAQVFVSTSMYKADVYRFWAAWLQSVREEQGIDGMIPKFVPFRPFLTDGTAAAWGDAATIVPWELYQYTGDTHVLAENYTMMKRWIKYTEFHSFEYISNIGTYGDWLQPYSENGRAKGDTHPDLIATAYYARSVDIAAKTARILGYESDALQFERLFIHIRKKFRDYFFDEHLDVVATATKTVKRDNGKRLKKPKQSEIKLKTTQTSYLLPLAFNLFNQKDQAVAVEKLLGLLDESDQHLRTGFLGTPMLYQVLQRYGHSDLMYEILFKESYPSWFYSINNGATTTWERWNSYSLKNGFNKANMNSLNHYAYGAIAQWFYNGILGIQSQAPGFTAFSVAPQFTNKLNRASGSVPTVNGNIKVSWVIDGDDLAMTLLVPKNTTAELQLPTVSQLDIKSSRASKHSGDRLSPGEYQITGKIQL